MSTDTYEVGEAILSPTSRMESGSTMRRRNVDDSPDQVRRSSYQPSWARHVQTADMFSKIDIKQFGDMQQFTAAGGIVSIVCYVVIGILFISELIGFVLPTRSEHLKVDTSRMQTTEITFHLTFPHICCADVHIDSMDVTGEQQVNVLQSVLKQRLDSFGYRIGREFIDKDATSKLYVQMPGFGLMALVGTDHRIAEQRAAREGCSIRGSLLVNKVEGNFHIAVGRSHKAQGHHVHNFRLSDVAAFNTSHTIHYVNFGPRYSGQSLNPLSEWTRAIPSAGPEEVVSGLFQYHIELTPTTYVSSFGRVMQTNQISVRDYYRTLNYAGSERVTAMPGVFFQYRYSPFMVEVDDRRTSLVSFLTSLCAIIGGVFAVSELINTFIHWSSSRCRRKSTTKYKPLL